jgi:hypothetical protein
MMISPSHCHTLVVNHSELILIRDALSMMIRHCVDEIGKGSEEPFYFCRNEAEKILERLGFNHTL